MAPMVLPLLTLPVNIFYLSVVGIVSYCIGYAFYDFYLSPLSKFPGPKLWILSRLPYIRGQRSGSWVLQLQKLHQRYGPIVRTARNEVSFIDPQAWNDIYASQSGRGGFPKNPIWIRPQINGYHTIISAPNAEHARYRRLLSHAFSDKALREQEYLLQGYVDMLIEVMRKSSQDQSYSDLTAFVNWFTFDIIGELAVGRSFSCLENAATDPWINIFFGAVKGAVYKFTLDFLQASRLAHMFADRPEIWAQRVEHFNQTANKVRSRLAETENDERKDFMSYVQRYNLGSEAERLQKGMTEEEIISTFTVLFIAGTETTATTTTATFYYLLKYPEEMQKLVKEIRSTFQSSSDINLNSLGHVKYLHAVIEEALRMAPPVPGGLARIVPAGGAEVCGHWLPGGTNVSVPQYPTNRSPLNFAEPDKFMPARWLPGQAPTPHNAKALNPFSIGSRNCLGKNLAYLELYLLVAKILWNFDVQWAGEDYNWEDQQTYLLWQKRSLLVKLSPVVR